MNWELLKMLGWISLATLGVVLFITVWEVIVDKVVDYFLGGIKFK